MRLVVLGLVFMSGEAAAHAAAAHHSHVNPELLLLAALVAAYAVLKSR